MQFILLPLHVLILLATFVVIFRADKLAFAWFRGKKETLDAPTVSLYHWLVVWGLVGMIVTGFAMFWPERNSYLTDPMFLLKMALVLMLVVNSFVIGKLSRIATTRSYASLSTREKMPLFISGAVSAVGWIGAIIAATLM